jgi:rhomboid protease GluP
VTNLLRRAPLTAALLAVLVAIFAAEAVLAYSGYGLVLRSLGANYAPAVLAGQWWRLVTSMFLHGGFFHLAVNGWALYQLGALVEIWMGSRRMAVVYFAGGFAGSIASVGWAVASGAVASGAARPSVGASGAIFALLGALISFLVRRHGRLRPEARSLLFQLLFWAGLNIVLGSTSGVIDNAAHLGGFAVGLGLGFVLREREAFRPPPPPEPAVDYSGYPR